MAWLVDGSNVLGATGADRTSVDEKRSLAQRLAAFARRRRTRVTCFFDGAEPPSFARHLGGATIVFSGRREADDLIVEQVAVARDARVVTNDRALAARVASRRVKIVTPAELMRELDRAAGEAGEPGNDGDWEEWFSDPENRQKF